MEWCRRGESNPRPRDYETLALPLSYAGTKQHFMLRSVRRRCQESSQFLDSTTCQHDLEKKRWEPRAGSPRGGFAPKPKGSQALVLLYRCHDKWADLS